MQRESARNGRRANRMLSVGPSGACATALSCRRYSAARHVAIAGTLLLAFFLGGCNSVSDDEVVLASGIVLKDQLERDYMEAFDTWWRGVPWAGEQTAETRVDNATMPAWAQDTYDFCVYWERAFVRESTVRQQGPDLIKRHTGIGWGWVLMNRRLEFHVLETGFRWVDYEDDAAVQSGSEVVIDAWDEPVPEDDSSE